MRETFCRWWCRWFFSLLGSHLIVFQRMWLMCNGVEFSFLSCSGVTHWNKSAAAFWLKACVVKSEENRKKNREGVSLTWCWRVSVHDTYWYPSEAVFYLFFVYISRHSINRFLRSEIQNKRRASNYVGFSFFPLSHSGLFCSPLPNQAWGLLSTPVQVQTTAGKEGVPCSGITTVFFQPFFKETLIFLSVLQWEDQRHLRFGGLWIKERALIEIKRGMGLGLMAPLRFF